MSTEEHHSGIPTKAIHEAYLDMQRALKAYREAKDRLGPDAIGEAHGELQQSVITFYELLRPYLKHEGGLNGYWEGELPNYRSNGYIPDPEDGKGIIQHQQVREVYQLGDLDCDPTQLSSLEDWHNALGLNGNIRITGIAGQGDHVVVTKHQYENGLKQIDGWETDYKRRIEKKGGFRAGKEETKIERVRVPIDRLKNAARELAEAAERLGALSEFDGVTKHTEITNEQIERVRKWQEENLE